MPMIQSLIEKVVKRERDPINKARSEMTIFLVLGYFVFGLVLVIAYLYTDQASKLLRAGVILAFSILGLVLLYFSHSWRLISHFTLLIITFVGVWANLLFYVEGVNIPTLQYVWLASALGFYMHGSKFGFFYAVINIVPVIVDVSLPQRENLITTSEIQLVVKPIYILVLIFNFAAITFLHYFFFRTFRRNIISLTDTKNQLRRTNEQLQSQMQEIKQLSNAKMNFLSTMSHELRTPLNGVVGLANVLMLQQPRKDQEETLAVLGFSAQNLLALINDILDFNKLESEMVELEHIPFSLTDFISNIYASTKLTAVEKYLDFKCHVADELKNITLIGDPTRLAQILLNLINNAIKFTEEGEVKLTCSLNELTKTELSIKFTVEDTGIGIEENQQKVIFDEFTQASVNINRMFGGTGLGLSIVKKVLKLHNSALHMESSVGKGTKLNFDIVFAYREESFVKMNESVVSDLNTLDLANLKVLVAEDNTINVMVMTKTLERVGIIPEVAENGKVALAMVEENDYDVILMDLYMPELNGYDATKKIRALADPKKSITPIIAITATVNDKVVEAVKAVGMNGYLPKPFNPKDLFEELRKSTAYNRTVLD